MARVEYCDNSHCRFNERFRCSASGVDFDAYAQCATACYDTPEGAGGAHDDSASDAAPSGGRHGSAGENGWIKYL